jgi:hypothetical protein
VHDESGVALVPEGAHIDAHAVGLVNVEPALVRVPPAAGAIGLAATKPDMPGFPPDVRSTLPPFQQLLGHGAPAPSVRVFAVAAPTVQ